MTIRTAILTTDSREHYRDYKNPMPYFGTAPEALLQGFVALPEIEVHVISCLQEKIAVPEKIAPNIWYHGLHVPKLGWLRTAYQGCIRAVRQKLKAIQPNLVHGQGTERDCALSAVLSGFPSVLTIHGNMRSIAKVNRSPVFSFPWLAARLEAFTIPRAEGVVCITNYTKDSVRDLARQTWIVPNAVEKSFFDIQPVRTERQIILCVGQVCFHKNQNQLIRALDRPGAESNFQLVFLGGVSKESDYGREFFDLLATRPWCVYGGFADREQLKAHLKTATLLALPSLEDNCPMVVLEAMAAGVPVVAAKVGGVPDLIEEAVTGLFCDPMSMESMRTRVAQLLEEPERASKMAWVAKKRALERFHPEIIARRHLEIYREVLRTSS